MKKLELIKTGIFRKRHLKPRLVFEGIILSAMLIGFIVICIAVLSGGWQIRPILSGSMRPGFPIGGVAITQTIPTRQLKVGDVAVFHPPFLNNVTYIHRIISISKSSNQQYLIRTKGDDNPIADPWLLRITSKNAYVTRFTLPFIGYVAVWVHSYSGRKFLLMIAGILAIIFIMSILLEYDKKRMMKKSFNLQRSQKR
jgi:signal peptidase